MLVGSLAKNKTALPVDWAVDRPTVIIMTVEPPVDRKLETESRALCWSTGWSIGAISREQKLSGGRPTRSIGPPAWLRARLVHVGRPDRSTDLCLSRPDGRPTDSLVQFLGIENLSFWLLKNPIKYT